MWYITTGVVNKEIPYTLRIHSDHIYSNQLIVYANIELSVRIHSDHMYSNLLIVYANMELSYTLKYS